MCGVGGDEENGAAHTRELDGERARGRGLADAAFAADEDPAQRTLVEDGLQRGLEDVGVGVDDGVGHGGWWGAMLRSCVADVGIALLHMRADCKTGSMSQNVAKERKSKKSQRK